MRYEQATDRGRHQHLPLTTMIVCVPQDHINPFSLKLPGNLSLIPIPCKTEGENQVHQVAL